MSPRSSSTDIAQPVDVEKDMHGLPSVNQGQPKPRPFTHSWSDPEIAAARGLYVKAMTFSTATTIIMLLAILSMYWGAFWQVPSHLHKLDITVVDLDGGSIGQAVVALFASPQVTGGKNQLSYTMASSRDFSSVDDVREYVLSEHTWGAVVVAPGASANLQQALTTGDATYNSSTVLTVLIVGARNENAVARLIQPPVTGALNHFVELYADSHSRGIPDNIDVRAVLKTAPQLINRPVSYHTEDIRPFDVPVASAVDFVGLIYLLVLVFLTAMLNYNIRLMTGLNELLSLQALIAVRFIVPFACYFFLSWFYSFISLAFQVPFSRAVGSGGFVLYWLSSFLGMSALGMAVESLITVLTPQFIPYFLLLWIISNASVAFFPIEVLPSVFRYGYAWPFYNVGQIVRTLVFDTKSHLPLNYGVLLAWIALSCVTMPIFVVFKRRQEMRLAQAS